MVQTDNLQQYASSINAAFYWTVYFLVFLAGKLALQQVNTIFY